VLTKCSVGQDDGPSKVRLGAGKARRLFSEKRICLLRQARSRFNVLRQFREMLIISKGAGVLYHSEWERDILPALL